MKKLVITVVCIFCLPTLRLAQKPEVNCNFSADKPLVISHALLRAAIKEVKPKYPKAASFAGAEGEIRVKILVDRKSNVVKACAENGHPLLRAAARNAALEWKFKENFGFSKKSKFARKWQLIQSELIFNFKK